MDKKEFLHIFNNSLKIIINDDSNSIFYVYNKSIERQIKYNRLFNLNKPIKYTLNKNDIIFEQDIKNKYLWYDYNKIFFKLRENDEYKYLEINDLIKRWLDDDTNWKQYTPRIGYQYFYHQLDDDTNWKQYTPMFSISFTLRKLNDNTNWKQYAPSLLQK